jgi:Icc-related predicted phosphoesterase
MRINLASDIHLEFGPIEIKNTEKADLLILSGDICVATYLSHKDDDDKSRQIHDFFEMCSKEYKNVIYIVGNHEHYNGDFQRTIPHLKEFLGHLDNLHILDKETVTIDDVTFIGGTLWTDMNKEDPSTMISISGMMNDFIKVANGRIDSKNNSEGKPYYRIHRLTPDDVVVDHKAMLEYIRKIVDGKYDQKFVVVGHHAPSRLSTKPKYQDEYIMNGAYSSDLSEFILDHPQIKMWTHGHTHDTFDYLVGSTRVVCNPRGYVNYEQRADDFNPNIIFEV